MAVTDVQNHLLGETTCGLLLQKLQEIWNEVGESDEERDKMLLELEQECSEVYRRKVDLAAKSRAQLLQSLSDAKVELSNLLTALGEKGLDEIPEKTSQTIKEQLAGIAPRLAQLWQQKEVRMKELSDIQSQIQKISGEIAGKVNIIETPVVDETDLSLKKLNQYKTQVQELQKEKNDRLLKVHAFMSTVHDLCAVLGMDSFTAFTEAHPSLNDSSGAQSKSISNDTLASLEKIVLSLNVEKKQRLHKLQEFAIQLTDLWNLMDTPADERRLFDHVTCNMCASADEVTLHGALSMDLIKQADIEVQRLDQLKASRMKEIAFKKQAELEEIFAHTHISIDPEAARENIMILIDSGNIEPAELIADMDSQIAKAKDEALGRKEILDKVEKWVSACEEESWLDDYNRDDNRYNASRGAHLNLKRAEKSRVLVSKIPAMVDSLVAKTRSWEEDHGIPFYYDGVLLLATLDNYVLLRREKEEEKRRTKETRKLSEQQNPDQEALVGSKPTPSRPITAKKAIGGRASVSGNGTSATGRRLSLNTPQNGAKSASKEGRRDSSIRPAAHAKEDSASNNSGSQPDSASP